MNVRKLMGRLNAKTIRFDTGKGGGESNLTPQDIAGALGMAQQKLGVELLCLTYWPDGAKLSKAELADELLVRLLKEFSRRQEERMHAALRHFMRGDRLRLDKGWPRIGLGYPAIVKAVMAERTSPCLCEACEGHEYVMDGAIKKLCMVCKGTGLGKPSDRGRAKLMGIHHKTFVENWREPFLWLLQHCTEVEQEAARQVDASLGIDD